MTLPNGSASATERTLACSAWVALPRSERGDDEDRDRGTSGHRYVAAVLHGTPEATALAAVDKDLRAACSGLRWAELLGDAQHGTLESEAAFAIDVRARTARRLGHNVGRDYEGAAKRAGRKLGAFEIPGAIDFCFRRRGGVRAVRDMKWGFQDVTPAAENGQLKFFAAALYLLEGETEIEGSIAKVKPDGRVQYVRGAIATYSPFELDAFLDELEASVAAGKAARALVRKRRLPEVTTGAHCRYCPAADACPGRMRIVRSMLPELQTIGERVEAMTAPERARAWVMFKHQIAPLVEQVEKALKESVARDTAESGGLPLGNGKMVRASSYERTDIVASAALALARELGASEEQLEECVRTHIVTSVREVNTPKGRAT